MKKYWSLVLIAILISCGPVPQKKGFDDNATYSGQFTYGNFSDNISFEINKDSTDWRVFFTSLEQNAIKIPTRNVEVKEDSINFILQSDQYTYRFKNKWSPNFGSLSGSLTVDTLMANYRLIKDDAIKDERVTSEEIVFPSNGLKIGATIWRPAKPNGKAIVFLTSSGEGDRSGSRAEAIYFANKGFTIFHYDKRGTGISEGNWQAATMENLLSDDIAAITIFSEQTGIPLNKIGIKGSSQGASKIPYILGKIPILKYGIAVSCPGSTLLESDLNYWKNNNADAIANDREAAMELQRKVYEHIAGTLQRPALERALAADRSKPWFPSIWVPNLDEVQTDEKLLYSALPYFQKVQQPVLIIQGTEDEIIPVDSHEHISNALDTAHNEAYKIVLLKDANHAMHKVGDTDFPYWSKLHSEYLKTVEAWIEAISER